MSGTPPPGSASTRESARSPRSAPPEAPRSAPVPPSAPPRAARPVNRWLVLAVLCVSLLVVAVDATVLHVAVPAVSEDLRPGGIELLWIVDAYPLVCASLLLLFGTLGDRIGRRRVLLLGYACFGAASLVAAYAAHPAVLIGARALLGVGGAMIMPATLSILRHVFPDRRERALAVGVWSAVAAVGAGIGPLVGGVLLEHFWWGSVFLVNIPLMAVCLPVARWLLPESTGDAGGRWDVLGALLAATGLFAVILAVKRVGGGDLLTPGTVAAAAFGATALVLFVRRQRREASPLIDLSAFARPAFGTSVGCIVLTVLSLVGLALIAAQYLQLVLGLSPLETGLRLVPLSLAAVAAGLLGSRMLHWLGPRTMVSLGFLVTAVAVFTLLGLGGTDRPILMTAGFLLLGFGLETTLFGSYESMLTDAPEREAGGAAAVGETAYQLGAGIGIALLGSIMNAIYAPAVRHVGAVSEAEAEAAGHSLGEAYAVAARVGGEAGEALRHAAAEAFVQGMHTALAASGVLLLLGALAALRLPRGLQQRPVPEGPDVPDVPDVPDAGPGAGGAGAAGDGADGAGARADGGSGGRPGAGESGAPAGAEADPGRREFLPSGVTRP